MFCSIWKIRIGDTVGGRRGELYKQVWLAESGWLTLRGANNQAHYPVEYAYGAAETSAVYFSCGNEPIRSRSDAEYFICSIVNIAPQRESHPGWRSENKTKHVLDHSAEARRIFEQWAREAKQ